MSNLKVTRRRGWARPVGSWARQGAAPSSISVEGAVHTPTHDLLGHDAARSDATVCGARGKPLPHPLVRDVGEANDGPWGQVLPAVDVQGGGSDPKHCPQGDVLPCHCSRARHACQVLVAERQYRSRVWHGSQVQPVGVGVILGVEEHVREPVGQGHTGVHSVVAVESKVLESRHNLLRHVDDNRAAACRGGWTQPDCRWRAGATGCIGTGCMRQYLGLVARRHAVQGLRGVHGGQSAVVGAEVKATLQPHLRGCEGPRPKRVPRGLHRAVLE